ncbi:EamA family transporter [Luteibaculum oceani]|uniref:EamA family transporter n=1 Tax=Luteibaculum oceani TaxID=1294296 RepID=A0A5C6UU73_9FLAO|nr:EamA family transporter [Luteibaculum oceani]TXC76160.1 EamA family transporter [Luteibaculum oceani]
MIYLALSILFSSLIYVVFSLVGKRNTPLFPVLIVNYLVAGFVALSRGLQSSNNPSFEWWPVALFLGGLFISIFMVMAKTTQKFGLATASVASKMSLVIPVLVAILIFNDSVYPMKVIGITLGIISVLLLTYRKKNRIEKNKGADWKLPIILFLGSGVIDTALKYTEEKYFSGNPSDFFVASLFFLAGAFGLIVHAIQTKGQVKINRQTLRFGVVLGVVNYGSIYYLLKSLSSPGVEASVIFPVNNVGIVGLSTLLGLIFFRERISYVKMLGLVFAVLAVLILNLV